VTLKLQWAGFTLQYLGKYRVAWN